MAEWLRDGLQSRGHRFDSGWRLLRTGLLPKACRLAGLALALTLGAAAPAAARTLWPKHRVAYYNATRYDAQVTRAVQAWNATGANVRLVAVPRRKARLLITYYGTAGFGPSLSNEDGAAILGFVRGSNTTLPPEILRLLQGFHPDPVNRYLVRHHLNGLVWLRRDYEHSGLPADQVDVTVAHELGHALGLNHDPSTACTVMRAVGCEEHPWQRACALATERDARRLVRLYGGRLRPPIPSSIFCDTSPGPTAPIDVAGAQDPDNPNVLNLSWTTPDEPGIGEVMVVGRPDRCARDQDDLPDGARIGPSSASAVPGQRDTFAIDLANEPLAQPGRYCFALWSIDGAHDNRPSTNPATIWLQAGR